MEEVCISTMDGQTKASSWAGLFKENRKIENGLKLREWKQDERVIAEEDLNKVEDVWGICMVGYILGRYPGRKAIEDVRKAWGVEHKFYIHQSGWMVFKFGSHDDKEKVLSNGPYNTFGTPWLLKELPPFFKFDDCINFIPTWVQLHSLPLECWNEVVLGKIVSNVGKPISTDQCTAMRTRPAYARVLVEIDINKPLVKEVAFKLPNGMDICQEIFFEHPPVLCTSCNRIGHLAAVCKKAEFQGRKRSISRGTKVVKMVDNPAPVVPQSAYLKSAKKGETQQKPRVPGALKIQEPTEGVKQLNEGRKEGENNLLKDKMVLRKLEEPCARLEQPVVEVQVEENEINLRPQTQPKNKGKGMEELGTPKKVSCEASSSNTNPTLGKKNEKGLAGIVKLPIRELPNEDSQEDDGRSVEKVAMAEKQDTSGSTFSMYLDMPNKEELAEIHKDMRMEHFVGKKDNGKKGKKGRSRHK